MSQSGNEYKYKEKFSFEEFDKSLIGKGAYKMMYNGTEDIKEGIKRNVAWSILSYFSMFIRKKITTETP